jgi:hypothetical protein
MKPAIILYLFMIASNVAIAKDSTLVRKKYLVLGLNTVAYKGSLQSTYARWTPAYQIGIRFEKKKILNGMFSVTFGSVIGEDRAYKLPSKANQSLVPVSRFKTSFFSLHYEAQLLLFRYKGLKLFASQGIGLFRFSVKDWEGNNLATKDRTRNKAETYRENVASLPTQLGLQYNFNNNMTLGFQAGLMNTFTDYLDNMKELSNNNNSDNVAVYRFQFHYPLK